MDKFKPGTYWLIGRTTYLIDDAGRWRYASGANAGAVAPLEPTADMLATAARLHLVRA